MSSDFGQFQELPEALLSCLPSCLWKALQGGIFKSGKKLLHNTLRAIVKNIYLDYALLWLTVI